MDGLLATPIAFARNFADKVQGSRDGWNGTPRYIDSPAFRTPTATGRGGRSKSNKRDSTGVILTHPFPD